MTEIAAPTVPRGNRANLAIGAIVFFSTVGLFVFDISEPRGIVDGVGYSAVVALASRFGKRPLIALAALTTTLTVIAADLLPNTGISVAGMWANRAFAIASIWIIATIMTRRLDLQAKIENDQNIVRHLQTALSLLVRNSLLPGLSFEEQLRNLCRICAEALSAESCLIYQRSGTGEVTILQAWRKHAAKTYFVPGTSWKEDPAHSAKLKDHLVVATDDVAKSEFAPEMRQALLKFGVSATLVAEAIHEVGQSGAIGFGDDKPRKWNDYEMAFARSAASVLALLLSTRKNAQTLAALDFASDGIYLEDANGQLQYANRAARGFFAGVLADRPAVLSDLSGDRDEQKLKLETSELELHRVRLPTGGLIGRIDDVSERNRANAERELLQTKLYQAVKLEAIGQLAGGIAHDFSNILAAIFGFASFIAEDLEPGSQDHDFSLRIRAACEKGKALIAQISAFAEAKTLAPRIVDLGRLVEDNLALAEEKPNSKITLLRQLPEAPIFVLGNAAQLGQLIANLYSNAREALGADGGRIEVSLAVAPLSEIQTLVSPQPRDAGERLLGDVDMSRNYAMLKISDNGAGIPADIMDRIFDPFFSTKGQHRGGGLGLAVVKSAILAHDGICRLRSAVGEGTSFSVYLPLAENSVLRAAPWPSGLAYNLCTVLIVDDDIDTTDMLSIGLTRLGFDVVAVHSPLDAIAALEESPDGFDVVLTDYDMPQMKGTELVRRIKAQFPQVRTVICTGRSEEAAQGSDANGGADALLRKPVEFRELASVLSNLAPNTADA